MRKAFLSLGLIASFATSAASAADEPAMTREVQTETGSAKLEMPAIKDRRKMLFQFGLFGTGMHIGWKKKRANDGSGEFRGIGSPIFFGSVGHKGFGLGVPKTELIKPQS